MNPTYEINLVKHGLKDWWRRTFNLEWQMRFSEIIVCYDISQKQTDKSNRGEN